MLRKLLKYDFLSIRRYLIPLLLLTPALSFIAGMISFLSAKTSQALVTLGLKSIFFFSIFALALSVALLPVLLVVRYYAGLYSDSGYLTLMLPVKRRMLIFSKLLCAFLSELSYIVVAFFSFVFALGAGSAAAVGRNPFYGYKIIFDGIRGFLQTAPLNAALLVVEILAYVLVWVILQFSILYLGVTLGAVIFQGKGKILGGVLFCFVTNTAVSTLLSLIELAISGGIIGIGSLSAFESGTTLQIFFAVEIILRLGISVGLYFFNVRMTEKKLNLG